MAAANIFDVTTWFLQRFVSGNTQLPFDNQAGRTRIHVCYSASSPAVIRSNSKLDGSKKNTSGVDENFTIVKDELMTRQLLWTQRWLFE